MSSSVMIPFTVYVLSRPSSCSTTPRTMAKWPRPSLNKLSTSPSLHRRKN
jgi:hypothetical protein